MVVSGALSCGAQHHLWATGQPTQPAASTPCMYLLELGGGALCAHPRCLGGHINAGMQPLEEDQRAAHQEWLLFMSAAGEPWQGGLALMLACQRQSYKPISRHPMLEHSTLQHRVAPPSTPPHCTLCI